MRPEGHKEIIPKTVSLFTLCFFLLLNISLPERLYLTFFMFTLWSKIYSENRYTLMVLKHPFETRRSQRDYPKNRFFIYVYVSFFFLTSHSLRHFYFDSFFMFTYWNKIYGEHRFALLALKYPFETRRSQRDYPKNRFFIYFMFLSSS